MNKKLGWIQIKDGGERMDKELEWKTKEGYRARMKE